MALSQTIGVIGGSGQLGGAIARAWLRSGCVAPAQLWISNRSGTVAGFEDWPGINLTTCNQDLVDACSIVLLTVPPQLVSSLDIRADHQLILSVMAGVSFDQIRQLTQATRIVRAMSSPAADLALAYSPWCVGSDVTDSDRDIVQKLFEACGESDQVPNEDQIDHFTALTGPVPGFVAFYASCMVDYAVKHGIDTRVANRAIQQLFRASGAVLGASSVPPKEHVREMIDYAGTTAAGLAVMKASTISEAIGQGLDAAYEKAKSIAPD